MVSQHREHNLCTAGTITVVPDPLHTSQTSVRIMVYRARIRNTGWVVCWMCLVSSVTVIVVYIHCCLLDWWVYCTETGSVHPFPKFRDFIWDFMPHCVWCKIPSCSYWSILYGTQFGGSWKCSGGLICAPQQFEWGNLHPLDLWLQTNYDCSQDGSHLACTACEMVVILRRHYKKTSLKSEIGRTLPPFFGIRKYVEKASRSGFQVCVLFLFPFIWL